MKRVLRWALPVLLLAAATQANSLIGLEALGQENTPRGGAAIRHGYSYLNPAIMAWEDKTSFGASIVFDQTLAKSGDHSLTQTSFGVPDISMAVPLGFMGSIGVGLHQLYVTDNELEFSDSAQGYDTRLDYSGSVFEVVPAYALRLPFFLSDFSVGVNARMVFGRNQRTLAMAGVSEGVADEDQWALGSSTMTATAKGNWKVDGNFYERYGASLHYHRKQLDYYVGMTAPYTLHRTLDYSLQFSNTDTLYPAEAAQKIEIPMLLATGVHWRIQKKHNLSLEYSQQAWDNKIPNVAGVWNLADSSATQTQKLFSMEYELEGSGLYYDSFLKRNSYHVSAWYKDWYLSDVSEYGASLGMGMPLGRRGTLVDVSLFGGMRDAGSSGAWDETFWGVRTTLMGVGTWGQKSRRY